MILYSVDIYIFPCLQPQTNFFILSFLLNLVQIFNKTQTMQ